MSFFLHSRNLEYVCKEGGKCIVDVSRRNQCQACRFAKCLEANMRREGKLTWHTSERANDNLFQLSLFIVYSSHLIQIAVAMPLAAWMEVKHSSVLFQTLTYLHIRYWASNLPIFIVLCVCVCVWALNANTLQQLLTDITAIEKREWKANTHRNWTEPNKWRVFTLVVHLMAVEWWWKQIWCCCPNTHTHTQVPRVMCQRQKPKIGSLKCRFDRLRTSWL